MRLEQVVVNLLNNAAKYTDSGGLIRLSVSSAGGEAVLKVWDNGLGMPPEMLPRIFDLFTQVDATLSRSHGGLGVGLALVRTLVEMHDGRVQAFSAGPNQGSEFTVILPCSASVPAEQARAVLNRLPPTGPSLRVLVVEDNIDAGDSLSLLLRLHGHEVLVARTGPSALEVASAFWPHVVLWISASRAWTAIRSRSACARNRNSKMWCSVRSPAIRPAMPISIGRSKRASIIALSSPWI